MSNALRIVALVSMVVAAAASASAPKQHTITKSREIPSSFDAVWSGVIEVFAEHNWPIQTLEKDSGLVATDWMTVDLDPSYADCGGSGITSVDGRAVRFNVFVRDQSGAATLTVNATFRELRSLGRNSSIIDCVSTGGVEAMIQSEVAQLASRADARRAPPAPPAPAPAPPTPPAPAPSPIPDGAAGGHCYGNHTCNEGLTCDDVLAQCVPTSP